MRFLNEIKKTTKKEKLVILLFSLLILCLNFIANSFINSTDLYIFFSGVQWIILVSFLFRIKKIKENWKQFSILAIILITFEFFKITFVFLFKLYFMNQVFIYFLSYLDDFVFCIISIVFLSFLSKFFTGVFGRKIIKKDIKEISYYIFIMFLVNITVLRVFHIERIFYLYDTIFPVACMFNRNAIMHVFNMTYSLWLLKKILDKKDSK